jgi:sigma-B regulation protein RsbU (phosphoserine phosphatase)
MRSGAQNRVASANFAAVPTSDATLDRLLRLSAFDGDSAEALRVLHAHFAERFAACSLALVLVDALRRGECRIAGMIGTDGHEHVANVDPFGERTTLPRFDDALTATLFRTSELQTLRLAAGDAIQPFAQAMRGPAALLGVPIVNSGTVRHWLIFGSNSAYTFDGIDREALLLEVNLAASLIVRPIATRALRNETARQREAIEGLADVQRLLLPDNPVIRGLDYAVHWQPAETAAGDYYDLVNLTARAPADFPRDPLDLWALTLADVSGHGAAAAMEAVQFDAILRTYQGDEQSGPAGALTYANRYFFSRRQRHHFLTAFALLYRPDLRRATYVDAGHPPLLHKRGGEVVARGAGEQIPLGILRDHVFENSSFAIESGDTLVLHTDGIVETRNALHQPFGSERLSALVAGGPAEPDALLALLRDEVIAHQGGPLGVDDQTLIVLRITH